MSRNEMGKVDGSNCEKLCIPCDNITRSWYAMGNDGFKQGSLEQIST